MVIGKVIQSKKGAQMEVATIEDDILPVASATAFSRQETESGAIAERYQRALSLLNDGLSAGHKLTSARVARMMDLEKVSDFESIILGCKEPSFSFSTQFARMFGINDCWLIEGIGEPFLTQTEDKIYPENYLEDIRNSGVYRICFVRATDEEGSTTIVLKINEYYHERLDAVWHISDRIGGTGTEQLLSMYRLLLTLNRDRAPYSGYALDKDTLWELVNGLIFPGQVLNGQNYSYWCFDISDINNEHYSQEEYMAMYGRGFVLAQEIIRDRLHDR